MNKAIEKYQNKLQMIFTVLPTNKLELYAAVKKICYIDNGRKF
jgi:hypothetical protein